MSRADIEKTLRRDVEVAEGNLRRFLDLGNLTGVTGAVQVGVAAVVVDDEGRFLVSERLGDKHGAGALSFPGGKPDPGEAPAQACLRELAEETGIRATFTQPLGLWTYERYPTHDLHFVTLYFLVDHEEQEPQNLEPEKHAPWEWISREEMEGRKLFGGVGRVAELLS